MNGSIGARGAVAIFLAGLIVGVGVTGSFARDQAPAWSATASLATPRAYPQGLLLATGKVLITGGFGRSDGVVMRYQAEVFDVATGRSQVIEQPRAGRLFASATTLRDDEVLLAGGAEKVGDGFIAHASADLFDPWSGKWRTAAAMRQPRSDHGATLLRDGRVLIVGGHDGPRTLRSVEIYDPATNLWSAAAPLPLARWTFSIATLLDGRVLVAGGFMDPGNATDTSLYYDPLNDTWTTGPYLSIERANHSTVQLANGDLLLVGGQRVAAGSAERYDWRSGEFVYAGTLNQPRMVGQSAQADDGSVVLIGGILRPGTVDGFIPNAFVERWDPRTNLWTDIASAPTARAGAVIVAVAGHICVLGGSERDDEPLATAECLRSP